MFTNPVAKILRTLSVNKLCGLLRQSGTEPVIMLGAGASVKSGIPLASDMAHQALRWAMALGRNQQPEDPRIRESDVRVFLESQPWFETSSSVDSLYQNSMQLLNTPRGLRRTFLMEILHNVSEPSEGYVRLANLAKRGVTRTILTTNFDDRFEVAYAHGALLVAATKEGYKATSTAPQHPQLIYLHGKAEYYMDRIMTDEVQNLDADLVDRILPLLRDHPLIVIGYRGAEPSVMRGLFLDHICEANYFPQGIFWCVLDSQDSDGLSPLTKELGTRVGDNFALVNIGGFDEFMAEFSDLVVDDMPQGMHRASSPIDLPATAKGSFDLEIATDISKDRLHLPALHNIVREHSRRIGIVVPSNPDDEWYEYRLKLMGLLKHDRNDELKPTNAAVLLCSDEGRKVTRGHWVEIRTPDRPPNAVDGSLLHIYESVFLTLQQANRPLRVKGYRSRDQLQYGNIAIKELLANALIHRDYESSEPSIIFVGKDYITFENPGGLDEPIVQQITRTSGTSVSSVGAEFQDRVNRRDVGVGCTAYRNPVLADVFWGLGYVDKAGSGLMDAVHSLKEIGGDARIQVPESNNAFAATISTPQIEISDVTHTAKPKKPTLYFSNLVEFESIPSLVWSANSLIVSPRDAAILSAGREFPSFSLRSNRLYSFSNLSADDCALRPLIDVETVENFALKSLMGDTTTATIVPELLRKVVEHRMWSSGLRVDRRRRRAYFACYTHDFRSVTYRALHRTVSRRVARWPDRLGVGICVHSAVNYNIFRGRLSWGVTLQPTFLISTDGRSNQVPSREHAGRVTSLLSDHYNPKVLADLRFWLTQLETEPGFIRIEQDNTPAICINTSLVIHEGYSASG